MSDATVPYRPPFDSRIRSLGSVVITSRSPRFTGRFRRS